MKAKYYIGILSALLLAGMPVKAQYADDVYLDNDNAGARTVVNNYYDDYDYYYSSRINRFHRSYAVFDYYSPFFTDTYWYSYRPFTWGLSIYRGGLVFSIGYNFSYPVYYGYDYSYDYGWYDPYNYSYNYWGYDPYYYNPYYWCYSPFRYNNWYTPIVFNIGYRNRWNNNYWGWNRWNHNSWGGNRNNYSDRYYARSDNRSYRNSNNNYYNGNRLTRYSSRNNNTFNESRRPAPEGGNRQGTISSGTRRNPSEKPGTSVMHNNNTQVRSNMNNQSAGRRSVNQSVNRNTTVNNQVNRSRSINQPVNRTSNENIQASDHRIAIQPTNRSSSVNTQVNRARSGSPAYRTQGRAISNPSRPSNNTGNQLSASRRSSTSNSYSPSPDKFLSAPSQNRSYSAPAQSRSYNAPSQSYSAPRRESSMSQGHSSSQPASHSSSSGSSRSDNGGGRRR